MPEEKENKKPKKENNFTKPKINNLRKNDIRIIGDNILYNNGIITAFYILPLVNYSTASQSGISSSITKLVNMIANLNTTNPELTFTLERIEKKLKVKAHRFSSVAVTKIEELGGTTEVI